MNEEENKVTTAKPVEEGDTMTAPRPSAWRTMGTEIYKDKIALVAIILFVSTLLAIFIGSAILTGTPGTETNLLLRNAPRTPEFILGNDSQGRGVFEMLIIGGRNTILVGASVAILANTFGILLGLVAGFYGGHIDNVIMRFVDTWQMLPTLMMIIVVVSIMPNYQVHHFVLVMAAFGWVGTCRIMRAKALQQRNLDYVSASKTLGTRNIVIMFREVFPALVPVITVNLTLGLAGSMGIETGLTFLGFGLPLGTPSVGRLIALANNPATLQFRMNQWLPASLLIFGLMMCIYCVGQALNRASDVRSRRG